MGSHGGQRRGTLFLHAGLCLFLLLPAAASADAPGTGYEVEWFDSAEAAPVARDAIEQALSEPWLDAVDVRLEVSDGDGMPATLGSCSDYLEVADARVRSVHGGTTAMIFQAQALGYQAATLALAAQPAAISHLRPLVFDEGLPDRLPWQVAMITSGAEAERIAAGRPDATWRQALFGPLTDFSSCGTYCGRYGDPGAEQVVQLVARGDFDGDGIEDMLLSSSDAAKGGSYRAVRMFVLTRRQADGRVELVRELDY